MNTLVSVASRYIPNTTFPMDTILELSNKQQLQYSYLNSVYKNLRSTGIFGANHTLIRISKFNYLGNRGIVIFSFE